MQEADLHGQPPGAACAPSEAATEASDRLAQSAEALQGTSRLRFAEYVYDLQCGHGTMDRLNLSCCLPARTSAQSEFQRLNAVVLCCPAL